MFTLCTSNHTCDKYVSRRKHTNTDTLSARRHAHTYSSPQKTPQATPERPWRLCWSSMATADIALHSLFILSVLGPARFTYSPLHSLAANRLWTSRLSIMEGSLTVFWQAHWIDSSESLFIFACLTIPMLSRVQSPCLHEFKVQPASHPPASPSWSHPTYPCQRAAQLTLTK